MPEPAIFAEGEWCTICGFFEVADYDERGCNSCGCDRSVHRSAVVMSGPV